MRCTLISFRCVSLHAWQEVLLFSWEGSISPSRNLHMILLRCVNSHINFSLPVHSSLECCFSLHLFCLSFIHFDCNQVIKNSLMKESGIRCSLPYSWGWCGDQRLVPFRLVRPVSSRKLISWLFPNGLTHAIFSRHLPTCNLTSGAGRRAVLAPAELATRPRPRPSRLYSICAQRMLCPVNQ